MSGEQDMHLYCISCSPLIVFILCSIAYSYTLSLNIHYRFPFNTTECYFASDFSAHTSSLAEYLHSHGL